MSITREKPTSWGEGPFDKAPTDFKGILAEKAAEIEEALKAPGVHVEVKLPADGKPITPLIAKRRECIAIQSPEHAAELCGAGSWVHIQAIEAFKTPEQRAKEKAESEAARAHQKELDGYYETGFTEAKEKCVRTILDMMLGLTDKHELMLLTEVLVAVKSVKEVDDGE